MTSGVAGAAGSLALALLLGACSGDDGGSADGATATSSLDPGVTFENDVTVPPTGPGRPGATTTSAPPAEVETVPREVPDGFPADFPVPDDAIVEVGSAGAVEGEQRFAVDYSIAASAPRDVFDFYVDAIDRAGHSVLLSDTDGSGQSFIGQLVFETDAYVGNVLVSGDGDAGVLLTLTATRPD